MIEQISIFTENKKGAAKEILGVLSKEDINILSFINSDSGEFGTMRMIVSDTEKAMESLKAAGYLCKKDKVLAVELEDQPGALEKLLEKIENMNINISYMYVGFLRENNMPVITIHCEEMEIVAKSLERSGYITH